MERIGHPAGVRMLLPRADNRINGDQIPRPQHHSFNNQLNEPAGPRISSYAVSSRSYVTYVEERESTPRYIRASVNMVANSAQVQEECNIPVSLTVTPMPNLNSYEAEPFQIDLTPHSAVFNEVAAPQWSLSQLNLAARSQICENCGAFVNAFFVFSYSETRCNICESTVKLAPWYIELLQRHNAIVQNDAQFVANLREEYNLRSAYSAVAHPLLRGELLQGTVDHQNWNLTAFKTTEKTLSVIHQKSIAQSLSLGAGFQSETSVQSGKKPYRLRKIQILIFCVDVCASSMRSNLAASLLYYINVILQKAELRNVCFCILAYSSDVTMFRIKIRENHLKVTQIDSLNLDYGPFLSSKENEYLVTLTEKMPVESRRSLAIEYINEISRHLTCLLENDPTAHRVSDCATNHRSIAAAQIAVRIVANLSADLRGRLYCTQSYIQIITSCGLTKPSSTDPIYIESDVSSCADPNEFLPKNQTVQLTKSSDAAAVTSPTPRLVSRIRNIDLSSRDKIASETVKAASDIKSQIGASVRSGVDSLMASRLKNYLPVSKNVNVVSEALHISKLSKSLQSRCFRYQVSVSIFLAVTTSDANAEDVACYCELARVTGGDFNFVPNFEVSVHYGELYKWANKPFFDDSVFDVRCLVLVGQGLQVKCLRFPSMYPFNNAFSKNSFQVIRWNKESSFCIELGTTLEAVNLIRGYVQIQFQFISQSGQVITRVINKVLDYSNCIKQIYKSGDYEALVYLYSQRVLADIYTNQFKANVYREQLTEILTNYRLHTPCTSSYRQLIIPEAFRGIVCYMQSLLKQECVCLPFIQTACVMHSFYKLATVGLFNSLCILYPFIYPLHHSIEPRPSESLELLGTQGLVETFSWVPSSIPASASYIANDGIYLMDTNYAMIIFICSQVGLNTVESLLPNGFPPSGLVPFTVTQDSSPFAMAVMRLIKQLCLESYRTELPLIYCAMSESPHDKLFMKKLVEDRLHGEHSYIDFLMDVSFTAKKL